MPPLPGLPAAGDVEAPAAGPGRRPGTCADRLRADASPNRSAAAATPHRRRKGRRMIVSMTGFGDATAERDGTHYAVEIRSLNNRFFKPVIKLPETISGLEPELETMLREKLGRGSITFILKMRTDSAEAAYHINTAGAEGLPRAAPGGEGPRQARARSTSPA